MIHIYLKGNEETLEARDIKTTCGLLRPTSPHQDHSETGCPRDYPTPLDRDLHKLGHPDRMVQVDGDCVFVRCLFCMILLLRCRSHTTVYILYEIVTSDASRNLCMFSVCGGLLFCIQKNLRSTLLEVACVSHRAEKRNNNQSINQSINQSV